MPIVQDSAASQDVDAVSSTRRVPPTLQPRRRRTATSLLVELVIVFVGVSAAFLVDSYRESREEFELAQQIYRALAEEIGLPAEAVGPEYQQIIRQRLESWEQARTAGRLEPPPYFRIARGERPPTGVWDAAVASGAIRVIDTHLLFELAQYYNRVKSLGDRYLRYVAVTDPTYHALQVKTPGSFYRPGTRALLDEYQAHVSLLQDYYAAHQLVIDEAGSILSKIRAKETEGGGSNARQLGP